MILCDVNVLIYAHREECERHDEYRAWLEETMWGGSAYGISDMVLSSCLRILTHPRIFDPPTPAPTAIAFIRELREDVHSVVISPGSRHWGIFLELCEKSEARGNIVADAYLAALAIESGSEWITTDRDFARFPGLRWRHPLEGPGARRSD
jgi:toxin-antitoxin system PIN domain toxin